MGFCPYFLQAHESDGGYASPLLRDPSTPPIGTDTTLFCTPLLLKPKFPTTHPSFFKKQLTGETSSRRNPTQQKNHN